MKTVAATSQLPPNDNTFRAFLLRWWARVETRRWLRRSIVDDVLMDFVADCKQHPDKVPTSDCDVYTYLSHQIGDLEMPNYGFSVVAGMVTSPAMKVVDYLWREYLKVRP